MLERLGILNTYDVRVYWETKIAGLFEDKASEAAMEVYDTYPYRNINIHISKKCFDETSDERLERQTVHECLHAIVYGWVRRVFNDNKHKRGTQEVYAEENTVSLLEQWIMMERSKLY